jgi:hypothetical protein
VAWSGDAVQADPPDEDAASLVRRLGLLLHHLFGVRETADVVVADAVERTQASAGAVLLPDGGIWRVAAGAQLSTHEHRYTLNAGSWLVQEIARGHRGAIIDDTDVARGPLRGAPLASRRHLLVVPVPTVDGLLLVARDEDPHFDAEDLRVLAELSAEAAPLLAAALDTRSLARGLAEYRER